MGRIGKRWRSSGRRARVVVGMLVLLLAAGAAGGWYALCGGEAAVAQQATSTVTRGTVEDTVTASGTLEPARSATVSFEVSGTLTEVYVEAGDSVTKGQALARVGPAALVASRTAALATLEAAQTQLDEDVDAGASDIQVAADRTALVAAQQALVEARQAVVDTTLRASIGGIVTDVALEVGDAAATGSTGSTGSADTSGTAGVTIVSARRFVVDASVAAADIDRLTQGLQVELTVSGVDDVVFGTVAEVGRVATTDTTGAAVFPVTVEVTGRRDDLFSGTSADVSVVVEQHPDVLLVSTAALHSEDETTYVERVTDEGTGETERVDVELGETFGIQTEIVSGLEEGDVVTVEAFTPPTGGGGQNGQQQGFPGQLPEGMQGQLPDGAPQ